MRTRKGRIALPINTFINLFFIGVAFCFVTPFIILVSASLSNDIDIVKYGYSLIPHTIDFTAYLYIFKDPSTILSAYKVTAITSVIAVLIYLAMTSMCAYPLSRMDFKYRGKITFYLFFTMLFNGGLVPYYIMITKYMQLKNTYAALIIPLLTNVWYLFIMRTFFQQIPKSIIESAIIDGADDFNIFTRMVLPLSKPVLATVGLMQLLTAWNSWYPALLFVSKRELYTLQYLLQIMLLNINEILNAMKNSSALVDLNTANLPTESMRMAMCIIAIGPMLLIFPFFQKYLIQGLTVGSVKG